MTDRCVLVQAGDAAQGQTGVTYAIGLEERIEGGVGDFIYIPAGVPHLVANLSDGQPAVTVHARTDPNEQEEVVKLPELDDLAHLKVSKAG